MFQFCIPSNTFQSFLGIRQTSILALNWNYSTMSSETQVSVAIIGGGVAGLTLANICEQSGISYVLWESQDRIAPPVGASIGLMPNGLRILDQIGVIDAIEEYRIPHDSWEHRDADGTLYSSVTAMRKFPEMYVQ